MKNVAVVLSGCGFKDGSEITEAISTLIALGNEGAQYKIFAPNMTITSTNHLTGETSTSRNVLEESARIARGQIADIKALKENEFDAILFPGGYGAALNLCDWAKKGAASTVNSDVEKAIKAFHQAGKPIGAICIAPVLVAKTLGKEGVTVTIGNDKETAQEIQKTGAIHHDCPVDDYVSDRDNKVLTTPAYMFDDAKPSQVYKGISKLVKELVEMA